jgi:type VI secretion system VasD/TssJ family lipoprotein
MRSIPFLALCAVAVAVLSGCASSPSPQMMQPAFQQQAIKLNLKADARLNLYQNSPHTLLVCVYQLIDPNGFNQLADEPSGLAKLMECGRFDPSVASAKRLVIQPGSEVREVVDRAEGAKYLALAAGYYLVQKSKPFRLYRLPVPAGKGETFTIDTYLGPQSIQDMGGK